MASAGTTSSWGHPLALSSKPQHGLCGGRSQEEQRGVGAGVDLCGDRRRGRYDTPLRFNDASPQAVAHGGEVRGLFKHPDAVIDAGLVR